MPENQIHQTAGLLKSIYSTVLVWIEMRSRRYDVFVLKQTTINVDCTISCLRVGRLLFNLGAYDPLQRHVQKLEARFLPLAGGEK